MTATGRTFRERLLRHASRIPEVPALVAPGTSLSYGELAAGVHALARVLGASGVKAEGVVALTARSEVVHLLATLALLELGVAQVALASRDPVAMRARLAARVGATAILADRPEDGVGDLPWFDLGAALAASRAHPPGDGAREADPEAVALYLTGSGTTGEPKIIGYSQLDLAAHAETHILFVGHRVLRPAPVEYNNSKRMRLYTLWQGGTCVLADGSSDSLRSLCVRHGVSWLELSPLHGADLIAMCRAEGTLPDHVTVRVGGARAPIALRRAIMAEATPRLHVSYGTTETSAVSIADPTMHDVRETVGPPVVGVAVEVVRGDGTLAAPDEIGEIRLRAPGMATGYVGDAVATARHFRDGWFMPGDLASLTHDGRLAIHGRKDDMMIMNGINIFPAEIERILETHPGVEAAAAFPIASGMHGQIPVAAVELKRGATLTESELVAFARSELGVRSPRRIEIVGALPRNPQGKILKREIALRIDPRKDG